MATSGSGSSDAGLLILLFLVRLLPLTLAAEPKAMSWSPKSFGPDGPWNALEVSLGGQDKIALYPGRMWHSFVLTTDYCALNTSVPHCESGTYFSRAVTQDVITYQAPPQEMMVGVPLVGNRTRLRLDTIDLQFTGDRFDVVPDASMALFDSQMLAYPDGTHYPLFAGCLSLGAPDVNQTFGRGDNSNAGPINGTIIPWHLANTAVTPSSSFGLHLGSAVTSARVPGSLHWGGYDRNRVIGDVLTIDGDLSTPVLLKDIALTTIRGASPFPSGAKSIPNLLSANNATLAAAPGLPVLLDPCSPYLSLPASVCASIAAHLPVTFLPRLGLYLWDVASPSYLPLVSSAAALSFTLLGRDNTRPLTIHVPFSHLNLTLTAPLSPTGAPVPYFPCFTGGDAVNPAGGSGGASVLGRAFLQDAFLGAGWEKPGRVWLAQAPGPNIQPGRGGAVGIQRGAEGEVLGGGNDWETSWEGFWRELGEGEVGTGGSGSGSGTGSGGAGGGTQNAGGESGLSVAAKAGVGVGAVVAVLAVVAGLVIAWRRWKAKRAKRFEMETDRIRLGQHRASESGGWKPEFGHGSGGYEMSKAGWAPAEVVGTSVKDDVKMFEVDGGARRGPLRYQEYNRSMHELA